MSYEVRFVSYQRLQPECGCNGIVAKIKIEAVKKSGTGLKPAPAEGYIMECALKNLEISA